MKMKGYKKQENDMPGMEMSKDKKMDSDMDHSAMDMSEDKTPEMDHSNHQMDDMSGMYMFAEYNYNYLKSTEKTTYEKDVPVKETLLNLTGNMNRYIWSMNGIPLSETDKIKID